MTAPKKILVISNYPIKNPQHGGQKRTIALVEEYRRAGYNVKHIAIYMDLFYADSYPDDIAIRWSKYQGQPAAGYVSDLILSDIFTHELAAKKRFIKLINQYEPDMIEVEQTFLYKTIKQTLSEVGWNGVMVNSTHNVEAKLKKQILESSSTIEQKEIEQIVSQVRDLELFASHDADWNIVCTDSDKKSLQKDGVTNIVVAPNGIGREKVDHQEVARLKQQFLSQGVTHLTLFVGSGHPPNLTGYIDMIGSRVGFLSDDTRLVVVGGVADSIYGYAQDLPNYLKTLYFDHVTLLGRVEEKTLSALLYVADQIILPIVEGEGSNLKTAEAILADKLVVATTKALRSYEKYLGLPNITVADSGTEFCKAMNIQLKSAKVKRTKAENELADGVLWSNTLKPAIEKVKNL